VPRPKAETLNLLVGGSKEGFQEAREYLRENELAGVIHAGDAGSGQAAKI
jgi:3-hydroxyisobutyrate dehydrogenase-like beta-hydroxyacid dehydrogenase